MSPTQDNTSLIRAPIAVVLAWLIPGLGHIYLGHRTRGIIFLVVITLTFGTGVAIGGVKTVRPHHITHHALQEKPKISKSWWFFAQVLNGTYAITTYTIGKNERLVEPFSEGGRPRYLAWPSGDIGSVYAGVAGLLNLLIIIDALARAEGVPTSTRRQIKTSPAKGPPRKQRPAS